jgi:hypothetical protein
MKITMANENDIQNGISEIITAVKEFPEFKVKGLFITNDYYKQLINLCLTNGKIIITKEDDKITGCIMGLLNTNIFTATNDLVTVVTWVRKDRRNSSMFYRMHKLYREEYIKLKKQNKIDRVLMSCLPNKTNIKFEKLGYNICETTYEWR